MKMEELGVEEKFRAHISILREGLAELKGLTSKELEEKGISTTWLGELLMKAWVPDAALIPASEAGEKRLKKIMSITPEGIAEQVGKERKFRQITNVDLLTWSKILDECDRLSDRELYAFCIGYTLAELSGVIYSEEAEKHFVRKFTSKNAKKSRSPDMKEFIFDALDKAFGISTWRQLVDQLQRSQHDRFKDWLKDGSQGASYFDSSAKRRKKIKQETLQNYMKEYKLSLRKA